MKNKITFTLLCVALIIQSCTTERKALKYLNKHPLVAATFCSSAYPVQTKIVKGKDSLRVDTITLKGDSVDCPPVIKPDGSTIIPKAKCPDVKTVDRWYSRVDTAFQENTARLDSMRIVFSNLEKAKYKVDAELASTKKESKARLWWIIAFVGAIIVGLVLKVKRII